MMAVRVPFTYPLRVECGFDYDMQPVTALAAEIDGEVEIEPNRHDDGAEMTVFVEDAETGQLKPLSETSEPDLQNRIRTFLLTDPVCRPRLDEAEADERAAQWRERPRASGPAAIKEIA